MCRPELQNESHAPSNRLDVDVLITDVQGCYRHTCISESPALCAITQLSDGGADTD